MFKHLLAAASVATLATACATAPATDEAETASIEAVAEVVESADAPTPPSREIVTTMSSDFGAYGLDLTVRDEDVHPGDDFYQHVNGKWLDTFEIPADRSRYGAFTMLAEMSEQRVKYIIEDLAAEAPSLETLEGKIAAYYNAYMDVDAINAHGIAPARPALDKIAAITDRNGLAQVMGASGFSAPLSGWVDVDSKKTDEYIFYINQSGLGMGDRDYYLKDSERNLELRGKYADYLTFLLDQAGYEDPAAAAAGVIALETEIAKGHWDRAVGRNRNLTYNKMTRDELEAIAGDFPVGLMLDARGLGEQTEFVVRQVTPTPEEIAENGLQPDQVELISGGGVPQMFKLAATAPLDQWKAWLTAQYLSDHASVLPTGIDDATFAFYGTAMRGQEEQRERWKRAVAAIEDSLGEGVGKVYAARHFPPENKAAMDLLVDNLRKAMSANLTDIDWMGDDTKVQARDKLAKFTPKIGYTEKFETYDTLSVSPDDAFENMQASNSWEWTEMVSDLGQPIDRTEWFMLPQTVNAYYSPNRNEIVFPAAILQPPFFNIDADPAINYGGIGAVIGHEIGHGFDDQGAKSDGDGVLRNWWTADDETAFKAKTQALVGQYNTMCPLDDGDTCVNGALTLGENIGDVGGLSMAYRAYRMSLNGEEAPVIDGLTGDQRFFMSWAQVWRSKYREEAAREQLVRDPHSPPMYRVNAVVRNFDQWYEAFDIGPDHALYLPPEQRIRIW